MHLKGVRLRGFKSFADATELHFEPGVSVIVGPNGSGKSNVTESLKWAMASQPPSELRAALAVDVLFGGSARRAAAGVCEVELILDNEDRGLGGERPEISVMRRLGRDGTSTYLLNRVPVRRLDVQELLADAGLGRELHTVVGQGRVDEILLSRPADRRGLIEEAAGLGKFKRRRQRALAKLARVDANLARARDVESELRGRLRPLALQASAAERAAALVHEIAAARLELFSSDLAALRRRRSVVGLELARLRTERGQLDERLARVVGERVAAGDGLTGLAQAREQAATILSNLVHAIDRLGERAASIDDRLAVVSEDALRLQRRRERLEVEARVAEEAASRASLEAEELGVRIATLDDSDQDAALAAIAREVGAAREVALDARRTRADLDGRLRRALAEQAEVASRLTSIDARLTETTSSLERLRERGTAVADRLRAAVSAHEEIASGSARDAVAVREAREETERLRETERRARTAASAAEATETAAARRLDAADRALARGDGLAPASRHLRGRGVALALDAVDVPAGLERAVAAAIAAQVGEAIFEHAEAALEAARGRRHGRRDRFLRSRCRAAEGCHGGRWARSSGRATTGSRRCSPPSYWSMIPPISRA